MSAVEQPPDTSKVTGAGDYETTLPDPYAQTGSTLIDRRRLSGRPGNETEPYSEPFLRELQTPYFYPESDWQDGSETGPDHAYNVYCFNQDSYDREKNVIAFFHALGSSPSAIQGRDALWELVQRFPDHLVVAFGCEGTGDAYIDKTAGLDAMACLRLKYLEEIRAAKSMAGESRISLVGQSFGAYMAYLVAAEARRKYPDRPGLVENMVLMASPMQHGGTLRTVGGMVVQETLENAWDRNFKELFSIGQHASVIIPANWRQRATYRRLLSLICASQFDIDGIGPETSVTFCAGEFDRIAQLSGDTCARPNVRSIITTGDRHSGLLTDAPFCADIVKESFDLKPYRPSAA